MKRVINNPLEAISIAALCIGLLISIIKAVLAPITYDEAMSYLAFSSKSYGHILSHYTATNHVLHTLLTKISIQGLGFGEFAMRLPAILGRVLLLLSIYFIARLLFAKWVRFAFIVTVILIPYLIDFSACSRGYSLGLGFSMPS